MNQVLKVHHAEMSTAAVDVAILRISGKQVTLAVFRQLQREPLLSDDATLNGVPWGTVNYHPPKECGDDDRHVHVVWQKGTELRRDAVDSPRSLRIVLPDQLERDWLITLHANGWAPPTRWLNMNYGREGFLRVTVDDSTVECLIPHDMAIAWSRGSDFPPPREDAPPTSEIWAAVHDHIQRATDTHGHYVAQWEAIKALPQLFIAV